MTLYTAPTTSATDAGADCPRCGGFRDMEDGTGALYSCYFCHDEGRVPSDVAEAFYRAEQDQAERFAPTRLGIYVRRVQRWHDDDWGDECAPEPAPGYRLFTRLPDIARSIELAARAAAKSRIHCELTDDDLPY